MLFRSVSSFSRDPQIPTLSVSYARLERRLRGGKPRDGDSERRRADVVQPHLVEEMDRRGVAAVLAADAELEVLARLPPSLDADAHQIADALHVDRGEGILSRIFLS